MKISVTKVRKTRSTYIDLTDEALSATIDIVTITEHKLDFLVEMSDGRSYESTTTVAGTDSYSDCMGIDSPVNDIDKFSKDIEGVVFPDLVFYDDYDEYDEAESKNNDSTVAIWLMYPNDRQQAEQKAIDNLIEQVISAWSAEYFGNEDAMKDYIQCMISGLSTIY